MGAREDREHIYLAAAHRKESGSLSHFEVSHFGVRHVPSMLLGLAN